MSIYINKSCKPGADDWKTLPILTSLLVSQKQIGEVVHLFQQNYEAVRLSEDRNGLAWYYALCLDVLLDTSFSIVPFSACKAFYMENVEILSSLENSYGVTRFYANMWLW